MFGSKVMRVLQIICVLLVATVNSGWCGEAYDVRGWHPQSDASAVIDAKCTACHSRQRIEDAAVRKADMGGVIQRMEAKGVKLTAKEREVLGVFGQSPFKKK